MIIYGYDFIKEDKNKRGKIDIIRPILLLKVSKENG